MSLVNPKAAYNTAVGRFNGINLSDLWSISCILSCIEYFDSWDRSHNFLHPTLYPEKVALFHRAIIDSKSADYKSMLFPGQAVPYIFNALSEATAERTNFLAGNDDPIVRLRRLLSTMAHQQIRLQESRFVDRLGRAFAILHDIPNHYRDELHKKQGDKFVDLTILVKRRIGLSVIEFLIIGTAIVTLMRQRFKENITISDEMRSYTSQQNVMGTQRRAETLSRLIEESRAVRKRFTFSPSDLVVSDFPSLNLENIQVFLNLLARKTKELRALAREQPVYSEGLIPDRLNPLERYPIVLLDSNQYIVPNLRYFDTAITDLLHYILQESYPSNEYNQIRGYIQEIYLRLYVQEKLPHLQSIPEISYRKSKNRVEGPDLTLVDAGKGTLIGIESKAKRMRVVSRVHPGQDYLLEDLKGTINALEKLPSKIQDIYADLPEYGEYQPLIDQARQHEPIIVVVLGEGVYYLHEFFNDYLRDNPEHPLSQYTGPYCLMRIEAFEQAVEAAANNNLSLYDLLYEYWVRGKSSNINTASAENFLSYPVSTPTFTQKLFNKFCQEYISSTAFL